MAFMCRCRIVVPLVIAAAAAQPALAQLAPPGAVAATQSTEIFSLPFTISAPGSYRMARNLTATAAAHNIQISAADVTIDLAGHTINGGGLAPGIAVIAGGDRVRIFGGQITNVLGSCVLANFQTVVVEDMQLSNATINGVAAANGKPSIIRNVVVINAGLNGIAASQGSVLENVIVRDSTNRGFDCNGRTTFRNCTAIGCDSDGFLIGTGEGAVLEGCVADSNGGVGFLCGPNAVIRGCRALANGAGLLAAGAPQPDGAHPAASSGGAGAPHPHAGYVNPVGTDLRTGEPIHGTVNFPMGERGVGVGGDGIRVGAGSVVQSCVANSNGNDGIAAGDGSTIIGCSAQVNTANGIITGSRCTVKDCTATTNTGVGFALGQVNHTTGCTSEANTGGGFVIDDASTTDGCKATNNGAAGFIIDQNSKTRNCVSQFNSAALADGFNVNGSDSVVFACSATSNGGDGIEVTGGSGTQVQQCYVSGNSGDGILFGGGFGLVVRNHLEIDSLNNTGGASNRIGPFAPVDLSLAGPWDNFSL